MTTIRYFIPEDGDSELQPNVFLTPKTQQQQQGYPPVLAQVKHAFPLPGRYHFRFKTPLVPGSDQDKNAMAVWMDCIDDRQPVPTWRNAIVAKVTRISVEDDDDDDEDDDDDFGTPAPPPQQHPHHSAPPQPHHQPVPDLFGASPAASADSSVPATNLFDNHQPSHDLLGGMGGTGGDLLGMGSSPQAPTSYGGFPAQQHHQQAPQSGPFF